jgi:Zn-dependent peptidase ImmA (M78 family)
MTITALNSSEPHPNDNWVNPNSLFICRNRMNLDTSQVEELTGIPSQKIQDWERSNGSPNLKELELLARHYRCPVGYFFLDKPPEQYTNSIDFRGLSKEKIGNLSYRSRLRIDEFVTLSETLGNIISELGTANTPIISQADLNDDIEKIVSREREFFHFNEQIRQKWVKAEDAFEFWKSRIEARGVYVISLSLIVNEVRGASKWDEESPPTILVNKNDSESATGRTFTLLHEWAHLMLRKPGIICDFIGSEGSSRIEHFANDFAAEMMVSKEELKNYLILKGLYGFKPKWGDAIIDTTKNYFKVSRDVIAISLEEMQLAPSGFYRLKRSQWDKRKPYFVGPPSNHPLGRTKVRRRFLELGKPYSKLITEAYKNGNISMTNLSRIIDMKVEKFPDFIAYVKANE